MKPAYHKYQALCLHFVFFTLLAACGENYYADKSGNLQPDHPRFTLKGKLAAYTGEYLVDTTAVYLRKLTGVHRPKPVADTFYSFVRFFSNGQYFHSGHFERFPSQQNLDELTNGYVGYYTFDKNEVVLETFNAIRGGTYFLSKLRVSGDTLAEYKQKVNCWHCQWTKVDLVYVKLPVQAKPAVPAW